MISYIKHTTNELARRRVAYITWSQQWTGESCTSW